MTLRNEIGSAVKSDKVIIGYKQTIKNIKIGSVKLIVIANNIPEELKKKIEHNAKIGGIKMEVFNGSSKELGVVCGRPFPISVIAIRD